MHRNIILQGFKMKSIKKNMLIKVLVALCGLLPFFYPMNSSQGNSRAD